MYIIETNMDIHHTRTDMKHIYMCMHTELRVYRPKGYDLALLHV